MIREKDRVGDRGEDKEPDQVSEERKVRACGGLR